MASFWLTSMAVSMDRGYIARTRDASPVLRNVQAGLLGILVDAQADDALGDQQQDARHDAAVQQHGACVDGLREQAALHARNALAGEQARHQAADDAADAVDAEHI